MNYQLIANRCARNFGTNRATKIIMANSPGKPIKKDADKVSQRCLPFVCHYDGYHAESRTGIRAGMAALKKWWNTYHYVPSECHVVVANADAIYSNDEH